MNEIITFGTRYELVPGIKVLIKSAKAVCQNVTVIDLNLKQEVKQFLSKQDVHVFDANYFITKYNVDSALSPYTLKVIFFYLYCKHICKSTKVYMADFTDVLFQSDPFDVITNDKPYVISENALIKNCRVNSEWINLCFNTDIFKLLQYKEIVNGGMYLGTLGAMTFLLKQMTLELQQVISRIGNYLIPDQAALNKLVYFDKHNYNILNDFSLFNMAHFSTKKFAKTSKGFYKFDGSSPKVIHQYKANKNLEQLVYEQFN
jgi:hypothetical protein